MQSKPEGIYLEPDFRKTPPEDKPYCCRCQKPLKGEGVPITINWDTMRFVEGHNQPIAFFPSQPNMIENCLIGKDCLKTVKRKWSN